MKFSNEQLAAILNVSKGMIEADGVIDEREVMYSSNEVKKLGVSPEQLATAVSLAKSMDPVKACEIISKFNAEDKRYVALHLASIMAIDNDIDKQEFALLKMISVLCGLPAVSPFDVAEFLKNS